VREVAVPGTNQIENRNSPLAIGSQEFQAMVINSLTGSPV
jgi:hypothetical protein